MFNKLDGKPDFWKLQQEMLTYWEKNETFEKSVKKNKRGEMFFYDGPPFPTGKPHAGTVIVSFMKDMIHRYWTMKGFSIPRQWGWDCHGLPIENYAEKELGINSKLEIEKNIGVTTFNDKCYEIVSKNNDTWKEYVLNMGRWVDYDNSYKTMDKDYMESVIWAFKECYNKGLIYEDFRITPYCTRCETGLSISETRSDDSTRPVQGPWSLVKFEVLTDKFTKDEQNVFAGKKVFMLAWTTTPWTLPSNLALAVGKNMKYAFCEVNGDIFVAGESALKRYEKIFGKEPDVLKTMLGSELVGKEYEPMFPYFKELKEQGAFKVISADFVDENEGIGTVHIAPGFGEDDYWVCKENKIPVVCPVDDNGKFTSEVTDYVNMDVFEANPIITRALKERGVVVDSGTLVHNYPHCWRCKKPLIYKATKAWYFNIQKIKPLLLSENQKINWVPETVKEGRFGNWLENARDWNISRNRYWSTPIPVWKCECGEQKVLGSILEIEKECGKKIENLHRQYLDEVEIKCSCGNTMKRTEEVLDCWFESGSASFASKHYPFENKDFVETHLPSEFVVEYTGQIRCWFYYLHVMSCALFGHRAFNNCVVYGVLLDKEGKKLSKSSKNYTDPLELMEKYGTDAYRLYLLQTSAMSMGDLVFDDGGVPEANTKLVLPLYNCFSFFTGYANLDKFEPTEVKEPSSKNPLDRWILAKLYETTKKIDDAMSLYHLEGYVESLTEFVDGLTNWYIRRSRRRFWASGEFENGKCENADKQDVYETMYFVLVNLTKLFAPVAPFISESLYRNLTKGESVHLEDFPSVSNRFEDKALINEIEVAQKVIYLARSIRTKNNIGNRKPLSRLTVAIADELKMDIIRKNEDIILEELNIKALEIILDAEKIATKIVKPNFAEINKLFKERTGEIIGKIRAGNIKDIPSEALLIEYKAKDGDNIASESGLVVMLDLNQTPELINEGIARDIVRVIQDGRKQADYLISDRIKIEFTGEVPSEWLGYILKETLGELAVIKNADVETEVEGVKIKIAKA